MPTLADLQALRVQQKKPTLADLEALRANQKPETISGFPNEINQAVKGLTFGFNDELTAATAAGMDAFDRGSLNNLGNAYNQSLSSVRATEKQYEEENPLTSLALQVGPSLAIGGAGALTQTGKMVARGLGSGNLAARAAKAGALGAASGGLYGYGTGEGEEDRLRNAGVGSLIGAGFGAALPAAPIAGTQVAKGAGRAAQTIGAGATARGREALEQRAQELKSIGSASYKKSKELGATLNNEALSKVYNNITSKLKETGPNNARLHGDTLGILDEFGTAIEGGNLSLEELDQYRKLFSGVAKKNLVQNPEDAMKASSAVDAIDEIVEGFGQKDLAKGSPEAIKSLNEARSEWSKFRKFETVSTEIAKADGDPAKIKQRLKTLSFDKKKTRGFTESEKMALRRAASTGPMELVMKGLGRFGIDGGNVFLPVVSGSLGTMTGLGVPAAALIGVGTVARQGAKTVARGKAENVLRTIEGRDLSKINRVTVRPGDKNLPVKR